MPSALLCAKEANAGHLAFGVGVLEGVTAFRHKAGEVTVLLQARQPYTDRVPVAAIGELLGGGFFQAVGFVHDHMLKGGQHLAARLHVREQEGVVDH